LGATRSETLVDGTFTALISPFAPDLGPPELDDLPLDAFSSRPHPLDTPEDLPKGIRRQATSTHRPMVSRLTRAPDLASVAR